MVQIFFKCGKLIFHISPSYGRAHLIFILNNRIIRHVFLIGFSLLDHSSCDPGMIQYLLSPMYCHPASNCSIISLLPFTVRLLKNYLHVLFSLPHPPFTIHILWPLFSGKLKLLEFILPFPFFVHMNSGHCLS